MSFVLRTAAADESGGRLAGVPGPVGLQLWSLRGQFAKDIPGTLDLVKAWGFKYVELAGTYDRTPMEFKKLLDERGLIAPGGHFSFERFRDDAEGVARDAVALGLQYAGCAWIPHGQGFDEKLCRDAIQVFNRAGEVLAKHDLKFFYHVHGYEFQPVKKSSVILEVLQGTGLKVSERGTLFELLITETNPQCVAFEMDVFWIVHPGHDPVKLLLQYGARWQLLHLKGMRDTTPTGLPTGATEVTNNVPLGKGKIDYAPVIAAAKKIGIKWFILEDESPEVEKQVPESLGYLKSFEWAENH